MGICFGVNELSMSIFFNWSVFQKVDKYQKMETKTKIIKFNFCL
jgi:hypothetical protein